MAPIIATALLAHYRSPEPTALYLGCMALITVVATLFTPETYTRQQRREDRAVLNSRQQPYPSSPSAVMP
ncbi:MHS family MFS transporter [Pseudomonas oryzihabitans]|uniref:MHS family MFS transporter n=1 Tax=Pseudomonas oryzihabitans TaxID=47885 RepID=UPI001120E224|nr:MHS family MFS transporter [Pseudomonas psychrotolerans]QDD88268.1 hypothetical protein CCZ28_04320 [Pseudomonas psychrotolerans]